MARVNWKKALDLKVIDKNGNRISFGRAAGRYFAKIISGLTILIGYMMVDWTKRKKGLHDMIAGTLVIRIGKGGNSPLTGPQSQVRATRHLPPQLPGDTYT